MEAAMMCGRGTEDRGSSGGRRAVVLQASATPLSFLVRRVRVAVGLVLSGGRGWC